MNASKETTTRFVIMLFSFLLYAQSVQAHVHKGEAVSFLSGLKHPISGLDHVVAMIAVGLWSGLLYSIGFVMATGCLHAAGISIGLVHRWNWGQRALRVVGAAIALTGIFFMWKVYA